MNEVGKMLDRRVYRGLAFELWTRQGAWFWRLQQPRDVGGVIGAAGSEAEATEEARATIESDRSESIVLEDQSVLCDGGMLCGGLRVNASGDW